MEYLIKYFFVMCIFLALIKVLNFPNDIGNYAWEFMLFSFLAGSFVLNVNPKYIKVGRAKAFPQIAFSMIAAGILMLVAYGLALSEGSGFIRGIIIPILSAATMFISIFLSSFALSELLVELSKNIFYKD